MKETIPTKPRQFLRLKEVIQRTTYSRTRIYELMKLREFPTQIHLGSRAVGWLESDIEEWVSQKISESRPGIGG